MLQSGLGIFTDFLPVHKTVCILVKNIRSKKLLTINSFTCYTLL
ncbi:protein of unknown function [Tenacibaculum aestuariivivum]